MEKIQCFISTTDPTTSNSDGLSQLTPKNLNDKNYTLQQTFKRIGVYMPIGSCMEIIRSWENVASFSGKIVAYQTDSAYFTENGCPRAKTYFGFVSEVPALWRSGEKGYSITRLLKPGTIGSFCSLVDSTLRPSFSMRLATGEEQKWVKRAIHLNQAGFDYPITQHRIEAILDRQLSRL